MKVAIALSVESDILGTLKGTVSAWNKSDISCLTFFISIGSVCFFNLAVNLSISVFLASSDNLPFIIALSMSLAITDCCVKFKPFNKGLIAALAVSAKLYLIVSSGFDFNVFVLKSPP